jgi:hypothetical protein
MKFVSQKILTSIHKGLLLLVILLFAVSCSTVKPYQRQFLNDPEMSLGSNQSAFENYSFEIRSAAIKAVYSKAGGGCGCN